MIVILAWRWTCGLSLVADLAWRLCCCSLDPLLYSAAACWGRVHCSCRCCWGCRCLLRVLWELHILFYCCRGYLLVAAVHYMTAASSFWALWFAVSVPRVLSSAAALILLSDWLYLHLLRVPLLHLLCVLCFSQPWGFYLRVWGFVFGSSNPN